MRLVIVSCFITIEPLGKDCQYRKSWGMHKRRLRQF